MDGAAATGAGAVGAWRLIDTSTNGTLVNGTLVGKGGRVALRNGDVVHFGRVGTFPFIVVHLPGADSSPSWRCEAWESAEPSAPATPMPPGAVPLPRQDTRRLSEQATPRLLVLDAVAEAVQGRRPSCAVM